MESYSPHNSVPIIRYHLPNGREIAVSDTNIRLMLYPGQYARYNHVQIALPKVAEESETRAYIFETTGDFEIMRDFIYMNDCPTVPNEMYIPPDVVRAYDRFLEEASKTIGASHHPIQDWYEKLMGNTP